MFVRRIAIGLALLLLPLTGISRVHADQCEQSVTQWNQGLTQHYTESMRQLNKAMDIDMGDAKAFKAAMCKRAQWELEYSTALPQKHVAHKAICGARSTATCGDLACIQKTIEKDRQQVIKFCGSVDASKDPQRTACKPTVVVETMTEGGKNPSQYQVIVINNDCPVQVSFPYSITTNSIGKTTQHFTQCAPAKTFRFVAMGSRTSSIKDQRLTVGSPPKECK